MKDIDCIAYKNLRTEMIKKSISVNEIAKSLKVTYKTLENKLSGKESINLDEAMHIRRVFFPETDAFYLFHELVMD